MLDKKKHHFLQLSVIFGAVVIISLLSSWGYRNNVEASMKMMGQSMGKMMQGMHLQNITVSDLVRQQEMMESASASAAGNGMESHHSGSGSGNAGTESHQSHHGSNSGMETTHFITTATIVILLPFIIAGAVFLMVVWLK